MKLFWPSILILLIFPAASAAAVKPAQKSHDVNRCLAKRVDEVIKTDLFIKKKNLEKKDLLIKKLKELLDKENQTI